MTKAVSGVLPGIAALVKASTIDLSARIQTQFETKGPQDQVLAEQ